MKIVGILTYHNALNFGAAFQCKALYQYLKDFYPQYKVIVLNYMNDVILQKTNIFAILKSNKFGLINKLKKIFYAIVWVIPQKRFSRFFSKVEFSSAFDKASFDRIKEMCDYFVIGSDQLWNFKLNGGDTNYLLPGVDKKKVLTYATSVGTDVVPKEHLELFKKNVGDILYVSVREASAKRYIHSLLPKKKVELVVDPVFLLDRKQWENCLSSRKQKKGASFYLFHREFLDKAYEIVEKMNISHSVIHKICGGLSIRDFVNPKIKTGLFYGPVDVLNVIYGSEVVVTDSFHCVALSIVFHIDFFVFLSGNIGSDSRIIQLLKTAGLTDRIVNDQLCSNSRIDWENVDKRMLVMKDHSRKYLNSVLNSLS